jgi:hypothetical protein
VIGPRKALLQGRDYKVELDDRVGKTVVVAATAPLSAQPGFYCDVCECTVRDSVNYFDHINGKRRTPRPAHALIHPQADRRGPRPRTD